MVVSGKGETKRPKHIISKRWILLKWKGHGSCVKSVSHIKMMITLFYGKDVNFSIISSRTERESSHGVSFFVKCQKKTWRLPAVMKWHLRGARATTQTTREFRSFFRGPTDGGSRGSGEGKEESKEERRVVKKRERQNIVAKMRLIKLPILVDVFPPCTTFTSRIS